MRLTWLADELRAAWPLVEEHPGWETRTLRSFIYYRPKGIINHHTAGSSILYNYPNEPYWPNTRLEKVCNVTIKPNGVIAVLNSGWAYDSGQGAPEVLEAVKGDEPLPALSGLTSEISGNAHFVDAEVQHRGDGGPIEPIQYEALIVFNTVVCRKMGWDPRYRVIGHYEWAPDRKIDPYWDGLYKKTMPVIRTDTYLKLTGDDMWQYLDINEAFVRHAWEKGWLQPKTQATLNYFLNNLAELQKAAQSAVVEGFRQDWLNFRRAVTNGIVLSAGAYGDHDHDGRYVKNITVSR